MSKHYAWIVSSASAHTIPVAFSTKKAAEKYLKNLVGPEFIFSYNLTRSEIYTTGNQP
jgi:hypothetical protein